MDIKLFSICLSALSVAVLASSCKKEPSCAKMGYEFVYTDYGVRYYIDDDSIPLGGSVTLDASVPKTFGNSYTNSAVSLNENNIWGPLGVLKATNDPSMPREDALSKVSISPLIGSCVIDSLNWGSFRKYYKTTFIADQDSFKLKLSINPLDKGVYFIILKEQYNRNSECALFKYFPKIKDTDQHLYYLAATTGGVILPEDQDYVYCFKVY